VAIRLVCELYYAEFTLEPDGTESTLEIVRSVITRLELLLGYHDGTIKIDEKRITTFQWYFSGLMWLRYYELSAFDVIRDNHLFYVSLRYDITYFYGTKGEGIYKKRRRRKRQRKCRTEGRVRREQRGGRGRRESSLGGHFGVPLPSSSVFPTMPSTSRLSPAFWR